MKMFISRVLNRLGRELVKASRFFYINSQEERCLAWFNDNGDKTLRLEYSLSDNSVVFDLGGYEGQWASDIFSKYCCFIYVFEPVKEFATNIEHRFAKNNKISVHQFGLSSLSKKSHVFIDNDSSSTFKGEKFREEINIVKATDFIKDYNIHTIDLMKINIEGGEYELLEHFLESGFIKNINNIQIQFHDFIPNAEERMKKIQYELQKTHYLTYQYPFVWENWQRTQ